METLKFTNSYCLTHTEQPTIFILNSIEGCIRCMEEIEKATDTLEKWDLICLQCLNLNKEMVKIELYGE